MYKEELYLWIIEIVADKFVRVQSHAFAAVQWRLEKRYCVSSVVIGAGIIVVALHVMLLQMPRNRRINTK